MRILVLIGICTLSAPLELYGQERLNILEDTLYYQIPEFSLPQPSYPQSVQVDAHKDDSLALVALYNSTGGSSSWTDRSGWLEDPVSEWHGIVLTNQGRVRQINLNNNGLSGQLPTDLGLLTELEFLHLGYNSLTGAIPSQLGNLKKLTLLAIHNNGLSGQLPTELGLLIELEFLYLGFNSLTGAIRSELGNLKNLRQLTLHGSGLGDVIPPELGNLRNLELLSLGANRFSGALPSEIGNLSKLERLFLHDNDLSGSIPPQLGQLTALTELVLMRNNLSGTIPAELGQLTELSRLILNENDLSGVVPPELGNLSKLTNLNLSSNNLSGVLPKELGQLRNLETLWLQYNDLSGSIPPELGNLSQLRDLFLFGNDLSGALPKELGKLAALKNFRLQNNSFSGPVPDLTGLNQLNSVRVQDNRFLFADLLPNADLSSLEEFTYAPQDSIDTQLKCESAQYVFSTPATAQDNKYQWYRNGTTMAGQESPTLKVSASSSDQYHASITNNALQDLTLYSRKTRTNSIAPCQTRQFAHKGDSLALVELYNSTQGSAWTTKTGWLETLVSDWHGITLNSEGRVTDIQLRGNNLTGTLPSDLGKLDSLAQLDLGVRSSFSNAISGAIPKELGQLSKLHTLDLSRNKLSGIIPKELGNLAKLTELWLRGNDLTGTIPRELGQLTALKELGLAENELTGPIPPELGQLSELEDLDLSNNQLTGSIPPQLGGLAKLTLLWLPGNELTGTIPRELGQLSELNQLNLSDNSLSGAIPKELGQLTKLFDLNLTDNNLSGAIPKELGQLSRLDRLDLGQNQLGGSIPRELGQLSELFGLNLSGNNLSGTIPPELGQLVKLNELDLHENDLSGPTPRELGQLSQLNWLDLSDNTLSGSVPQELAQISTLEYLYLNQNQFSGLVPNLTGLSLLDRVRLQDNRFLFADLLPNATLNPASGFTYAPQDSISTQLTCEGSAYVFTTPATAQGNAYKWYRNGEVIGNEQTNTLRINASSTGQYHASVTNNALQDLTLYSRKTSTSSADPCQTRQFAHKGDSLALVELYNSTKGNEWTRNTGWLQTPVSEWFGITLDADGRVTGVDLESNSLIGQLPKSIGTLAKLDSLLLARNGLSGPIPPELGQLKELRIFWLSFNDLSGAVPAELSGMTKLEELAMTGNQLTGPIPPELGQLANLKYLWLASNSLSGTIPSELRHLEKFSVNANNLSGPIPTHLGEWANLIELHLCDNNFTGPIPAQVGQLSELEFLCLRNNQLTGSIPAELNRLSKLKTLWLHENHLSGPVPNLTSLNQLSSVRVQDNRFLFKDLLPNATLNPASGFTYAPQDSINTQLTCEGSQYVFTTPATAQGNAYKWYRDGEEIASEQKNTLRVSASSTGQYHASITNDALQDLTLYSRKTSTSSIDPCQTRQFAHEGDSLALVELYNSTQGGAWTTSTGWLQTPVSEWHGITLSSEGRVTNVVLSENNLEGSLPEEIEDLDSLRVLSLADNVISGLMPDLTSLKQLGSVRVQDNRFLFKDLLPNATFNPASGFTYAPQDSIDTQLTCDGTEYVFTTPATAQGNAYKWYRNGEEIGNEQTNTLRVSASSTGQYHASVTNNALSDLTLYSRKTSTSSSAPCQNSAPTIANAIADQTIAVGGTYSVDLTTVFSDPDNDVLTFAASSGDEATATVAISNNTLTVTGVAVGTATITVSATDTQGSNTKVEDSFTVTVTSGNSPPTIASAIADQTIAVGDTYSIDLTAVFSDADNDVLTFAVNSGDVAKATAAISNNTLTVTGVAVGTATITVSATDTQGSNTRVDDSFTVTVTSTARQFAHEGDSLVLVELYNSTEGNTWTRNTGWLQTPVSEWFGITLDADGRVTGIYLRFNNLVGQLPESMGTLAKLDSLLLPDNSLSGPIPPELGQLKELRELWLSFNGLSGAVPAELSQMTKLEELAMTGNQLTGPIPPELGQLANLKYLWLASNRLSGTIPSELRHLEKISVNANNLSGPIPTHLGEWANLIELHLCNNNFTGQIPPVLGQLSELEFLCLRNNQLSGSIPTELNQLSKLKTLWLHRNHLSGPVPDLTSLSQLNSVRINTNQFLFADLLPNAALSRLREFIYAPQDTIETQLTCRASEYVLTTPATAEDNRYQWYRDDQALNGARSDTLRISVMDSPADYHATIKHDLLPDLTLVSRKANTRDASACTRIAHVADSTLLVDFYNRTHGSLLWHDHTGWLEDPVVQWYGITLNASGRVTDIDLPYNNLVGQLPLSRLDQLAHLRYLNVSGNQFSGTIPEELGDLTQLEYLMLSHNKLAGTIPRELADQAPLKVLDISGNQLAGEIPTELNQITTLQTFSVSANQLSGPVPDFTGLDQLDSLHVAQNEFLFMDLLPNASLTRLDDFVYAPQDSIDTFLSRTASGFAFTTAAKAMGNRYQWYRDDQPISGPQSDTLHVSLYADPAQYHATITNDRLPALTLVSRKKGVHDRVTMTESEFAKDFLLHQSYPNPFAEATTVAFELGTPEHVRIVVYDLLGQVVAKIADGRFAAGVHRIEFTGDHLASGQYLYRMEAGAYQATRFMSVVR